MYVKAEVGKRSFKGQIWLAAVLQKKFIGPQPHPSSTYSLQLLLCYIDGVE